MRNMLAFSKYNYQDFLHPTYSYDSNYLGV